MSLRIQPEIVRRLGAQCRTLSSGAHQATIVRLNGILEGLRSSWSSGAQATFEIAFGGWLTGYQRRGQDLLSSAAYLDKVAESYEWLETRLVDGLTEPAPGRGGKVRARPMSQGNGPSISGPLVTSGGSLAGKSFNGTAAVDNQLGLTNVRLTYRADYAIDYYADQVVVRLTQYPSTNEVATPTNWSSAATVITRSGRQIQYSIDALDPNPIARAEAATLVLPIDPTDPPVRVDLYIVNVADGPAGAAASRQYYESFNVNVPGAAPTPTVGAPIAPTPTPNPVPDLAGPRPIQVPATPTPVPGPTLTPTRPTPTRPGGPVRAD